MNPAVKQREDTYRHSSVVIQELYGYEPGARILRQTFSRYHLKEELYREYALAFGDVVLGLSPEEDLAKLLVERAQLPEKVAEIIAHDLLVAVHEYKAEYAKAHPEEKEVPVTAVEVPEPQPTAPPPQTPVPQAQPEPRDEVPPPTSTQPSTPLPPAWKLEEEPEPEVSESLPPPDTTPSYARPFIASRPRYGSDDPYREKVGE